MHDASETKACEVRVWSVFVGSECTLRRSHGNGFCFGIVWWALAMHDSVTSDAASATAAGFVVAGYAAGREHGAKRVVLEHADD